MAEVVYHADAYSLYSMPPPALDGIDDDDANQQITAILDGGGELPPLQDAEPCEAEAPRDDHVGLQPIRDDASSTVSSRSQAEAEEEAAPAVMHGLEHFCKNYTVVLDLMKKYMIVFCNSTSVARSRPSSQYRWGPLECGPWVSPTIV